jgi:hypothetical protein
MTTLIEHFHLTIEREGDNFILGQIDHSSNHTSVILHISQLRHLAEVAGLLSSAPSYAIPASSLKAGEAA